ncbi:MAG TPA: metallopeptidase family protein [Ktedonobacteraceae bacterium]|jgi:predicted Zn-dependent protease with MMP-like domain|nr:metallopeptidase family protein [Ktedonobacteraceae bacterium]
MQLSEEEHDDDDSLDELDDIPADDELPVHEKDHRSRYFFAIMCFLIALILLSFYLNNHFDFGPSLLLLFLAILSGYLGILFFRHGNTRNPQVGSWMDTEPHTHHPPVTEQAQVGEIEIPEEHTEDDQVTFEQLVEQALTSIPEEFHEQMKNVLVRVESEPDEELLRRVGVKEGHTLLGLYEGVPLTAYGRIGGPEIITIYQNPIERYCRCNPDRIREQVRRTVLHEVAHHFGIDHDEMPIWVK